MKILNDPKAIDDDQYWLDSAWPAVCTYALISFWLQFFRHFAPSFSELLLPSGSHKPQHTTKPWAAGIQRPILNFAPRGKLDPQGWTWPPGVNLTPRGELDPQGWSCPLGVKFSVRPSILLNSRECSPLGVNEGDKFHLWGPLGVKLSPGGQGARGPGG
jgi:hypothetical protein